LPDYEVTTWYGVVAPAGTPGPVVEKLNKALNELVADEVVKDRMAKAGAIATGSSASGFRNHMNAEFKRWGAVREAAKIEQQ
jgi:tripartite-type tricarboxylate transporter receptor subunit TctC